MAKKAPGKASKSYQSSINIGVSRRIPSPLAANIRQLEGVIGKPIWLFVQAGEPQNHPFSMITPLVRDALLTSVRQKVPKGQRIALLIESPGGLPNAAFQIALGLKRHCGGYDVLVPKYAKSAATLLSLGADNIILSDDAELGPIDMQVSDHDTEEQRSVLEYVQSLERLEAYTLRFFDDAMTMLLHRTRKKVGTLLPGTVEFVTNVVRPLFEKVDVVQYTQMARLLKVMEDYASRLLSFSMSREEAEEVARNLTSRYADHGFVIDKEEASSIGLKIADANTDRDEILTRISRSIELLPNMLGRVEEI